MSESKSKPTDEVKALETVAVESKSKPTLVEDEFMEMVKVEIKDSDAEPVIREVTKALAEEQLSLSPEERHPHWKNVKIVK